MWRQSLWAARSMAGAMEREDNEKNEERSYPTE